MSEFNSCSTDKKSELIWEWGYYITHFKSEAKNIVLFSLGSFLAEVHYALPENRIELIRGISGGEMPSEFFNKIKSNPLVQAICRTDTGNYIRKITNDPASGGN